MSYQVLARKWRPRTFRDLVGQEHVLRALVNALDHDRLHHAYLFTGTRGVGKTTIARILAKCLNCEAGVSSTPCGQCTACVEIAENRFVDLIEVDAASRTKVEDTRELLENVQYAPTRGRYKVYLIDEVHMLSTHSFNALLKTLEEPPPHVKFLLATTDPQRLPVTILSRCLQFNLKNMTPELVTGHLKHVLEAEVVPFEESALWQLGRAADGSMRDALSLTDQAIAFGSGKVTEAEVRAMLGTIDRSAVYDILQALAQGDGKKALDAVAAMAEHAPDFASALADLLSVLHRIAIAQALPEAVDNSHGDRDQVLALAQQLPAEDVQLFYQTGLLGRRDLPLAPDPRAGLEMVLLRMLAFKPQGVVDIPAKRLNTPQTSAPVADTAAAPPSPAPERKVAPASPANAGPVEQAEVKGAPAAQEQTSEKVEPSTLKSDATSSEKIDNTADGSQLASSNGSSEVPVNQAAPAPSGQLGAQHNIAPVAPAPVAAEPQPPEGRNAATDMPAAVAGNAPRNLQSNAPRNTPINRPVEPAAEPLVASDDVPPWNEEPPAEGVKHAPTPGNAESALADRPGLQPQSAKPAPVIEPEPIEKVALESASPVTWPQIYLGMALGGVVGNTAANCELVGRQDNQFHFVLDEKNSSLYGESHQQRLADALSDYFGQPVQVVIQPGTIDTETPAQIAQRKRSERLAHAVATVKSDPIVQQLIEHFSAELDESSVEPLDSH